jgi:hypothetical protein
MQDLGSFFDQHFRRSTYIRWAVWHRKWARQTHSISFLFSVIKTACLSNVPSFEAKGGVRVQGEVFGDTVVLSRQQVAGLTPESQIPGTRNLWQYPLNATFVNTLAFLLHGML